jgi:hypothetical protein
MAIADFPVSENANGLNKAKNVKPYRGPGLSSDIAENVDLDVVRLLVDRALR